MTRLAARIIDTLGSRGLAAWLLPHNCLCTVLQTHRQLIAQYQSASCRASNAYDGENSRGKWRPGPAPRLLAAHR
jgi:hypothetical protein